MRLLLADDSQTILKVVGSMLESHGFEVITASDGVEAAMKAFSLRPDLILLDVMMPKMNGYQVCRLLKNEPRTASIPIIILTSKDQPREKFWGYQVGADEYVTKGFDQGPLLQAVNQLIAGREESAACIEVPNAHADEEFDILARSNDLLDAKLFEATIVNEIGKLANSFTTFQETTGATFDLLAKLVGYSAGVLAFTHGDRGVMLAKVKPGVSREFMANLKHFLEAKLKEEAPDSIPPAGYEWEILNRSKTGVIPPSGGIDFDPQKVISYYLHSKGRTVGLLALATGGKDKFTRDDQETLELFGNHSTVVLENGWLYQQIRQLSITDGLTKVYNRRFLEERLKDELRLSVRHRTPLALAMMDVDHFKKVNDRYGHQAGDDVLKQLMEVCRGTTRSTDILGRYGGEEFVMVLPDTDLAGAKIVAERIRSTLEKNSITTCAGRVPVTISLGLVTTPDPRINSAEEIIKAADLALYRAKNSGRNRVCIYDSKVDGPVDNQE